MAKIIKLKKVFREKYVKKRGSPKAEFTGHTTDYFIDGVPRKKKEWDSTINSIIDEEVFKLLTNPIYFNSLHWSRRREILLQVCGDVPDEEVIASDILLAELPNILTDKSIEDMRKIIHSKRKTINDRLKEIPARIDELQKTLATLPEAERSTIEQHIVNLEQEIKDLSDDSSMSKLRKQKAELEAKIQEARNALEAAKREEGRKVQVEIDSLEEKLRKAKSALSNTLGEIADLLGVITRNVKEMNRLREQYGNIQNEQFHMKEAKKIDRICPTCGQDIPEKDVQEAIQKYLKQRDEAFESFNLDKSKRLEEINTKGKAVKAENEAKGKELTMAEESRKALEDTIEALEKEIKDKGVLKDKAMDGAGQDKVKTIQEFEGVLKTLNESMNVPPPDTSDLEAKVKAERAKIAQIDGSIKTKARIMELADEEKDLAARYEELERQLSLIDRFVVQKVNLLEDKINAKFELARFKLFDVQINEGIKETCITLYDGVPYGYGLNTGAEINVGLDIIRTLQMHYGIKAPIFIDHAESVTDILDTGSQMIKLTVDKNCPELEVVQYGLE